jgi:hypothetical protein
MDHAPPDKMKSGKYSIIFMTFPQIMQKSRYKCEEIPDKHNREMFYTIGGL